MKDLQHYVPACYFANFGINGNEGRESHIHCLYVPNKKAVIKRVDDIALENHFYDVEGIEDNSRFLDDFFANTIEPQLSQLLSKITTTLETDPSARKTTFVDISAENKKALSAQMAFQYTRTRAYRDIFVSAHNQLKDGFPCATIPDYGKSDYRRIHTIDMLGFSSSNFFTNLFDDRHWVFLINHTEVPFITSDNPIIQINHHAEGERCISPVSPKAPMYFPLTPTLAIEVYHKDVSKDDMRYFDIYGREIVDGYNCHEMCNCTRIVVSNVSFETMGYMENMQNV